MVRYIFVTGGVVSSLGKGLAAAALGATLQSRGFKVRCRKFDPYLNVDPGTMSPAQHGEVYVTNDGAETDLDLGHYERFTGVNGNKSDSVTTGKVYSDIIARERRGEYLGATVQVIPHVTDRIKESLESDLEEDLDFLICEIGGTVGDIEGLPYLEAFRQYANEIGHENACFIHLTLVPYIASAGELKTKPTQHSVKEMLGYGVQPDILLCRTDREIPESAKNKLALFCNIKPERVIEANDVSCIYEVPRSYSAHGLDTQVLKHFNLDTAIGADLSKWDKIVEAFTSPKNEVNIAVVGKYMEVFDSYKSIYEALHHGGFATATKVKIDRICSEEFEEKDGDNLVPVSQDLVAKRLSKYDAVLVPGGYGIRGTSGKMATIQYCRENKMPFMGICYGMQLTVAEYARNVLGLKDAHSTEVDPHTSNPVVGLIINDENPDGEMGGTMRLGSHECHLQPGSLAQKVYGSDIVHERHRHRYEVNIEYRAQLEEAGLKFSGMSPDGRLTEVVEVENHPWFLAMQYHPEFKSRPLNPSAVFQSFVEKALELKSATATSSSD